MSSFTVLRTFLTTQVSNRIVVSLTHIPFAENKAVGIMKAGHTFTIEPMISEGSFDIISMELT